MKWLTLLTVLVSWRRESNDTATETGAAKRPLSEHA